MGRSGSVLRDWLTLPSTIVAIILVVLGLITVSLEAQSQNWVYFTGEQVTGTVEGGIVFYEVGGTQYTQDDPKVPPPADGTRITVYYHQDDPSTAELERPVRLIEGAGMAAWFVAAVLLLAVAALRRARRGPPDPDGPHWWPTRHPG